MPQLIMISHASHVNYQRHEKTRAKKSTSEEDQNDPLVSVGGRSKPFSQLTSDELNSYYASMSL